MSFLETLKKRAAVEAAAKANAENNGVKEVKSEDKPKVSPLARIREQTHAAKVVKKKDGESKGIAKPIAVAIKNVKKVEATASDTDTESKQDLHDLANQVVEKVKASHAEKKATEEKAEEVEAKAAEPNAKTEDVLEQIENEPTKDTEEKAEPETEVKLEVVDDDENSDSETDTESDADTEEKSEEKAEDKPVKRRRHRRTRKEIEEAKAAEEAEKKPADTKEETSAVKTEKTEKAQKVEKVPDVDIFNQKIDYNAEAASLLSFYEDSSWAKQKAELTKKINEIRLESDMNPGTLKVAIADLNHLYSEAFIAYTDTKQVLDILTDKDYGIAVVYQTQHSVGANVEERKRNGYISLATANVTGTTVNLISVIAAYKARWAFIQPFMKKIESMLQSCITMSSAIKTEEKLTV